MKIFKGLFSRSHNKKTKVTGNDSERLVSIHTASEIVFELSSKFRSEFISHSIDPSENVDLKWAGELAVYYGIFCCHFLLMQKYGLDFMPQLSNYAFFEFMDELYQIRSKDPSEEVANIIQEHYTTFSHVYNNCIDVVDNTLSDNNSFTDNVLRKFCKNLMNDLYGRPVFDEIGVLLYYTILSSWYVRAATSLSKIPFDTKS